MTLVRFRPFAELDALQRDIESIFNTRRRGFSGTDADPWAPSVNVFEDANGIEISVDLPGLDRDDVQINVDDEVLTISGERKSSREVQEGELFRSESSYGKFERSFRLPKTTDFGKISAKMDKGVLVVSLPKVEEAKPRQIAVDIN